MALVRILVVLSAIGLVLSGRAALSVPEKQNQQSAHTTSGETRNSDSLNKIGQILDQIERARQILEQDREQGDQERVQQANVELRQMEAQLNHTRIRLLSQASGAPEATILSMRQSGMGWGRIANEIGVHPSILGKGAHKSAGSPPQFPRNKTTNEKD